MLNEIRFYSTTHVYDTCSPTETAPKKKFPETFQNIWKDMDVICLKPLCDKIF